MDHKSMRISLNNRNFNSDKTFLLKSGKIENYEKKPLCSNKSDYLLILYFESVILLLISTILITDRIKNSFFP